MRINLGQRSGILSALLAAALFGASTPFAKLLLGEGINPWLLAGLLYCGAGIGLGTAFIFSRRARSEAVLQRADVGWLLLVVLFGGIAGPVLLMLGLARTPASAAALLLNLEGLATMAIAWLVFKEYVDRRLLVGALAILMGALALSYQAGSTFGIGSIAIVGACIAWGIDNNLTRKISSADPMQIAAIKGIVAGVINLMLASLQHASWPSMPQLGAAALLGFFGYGVSVVLFVFALRALGTARTGAYFSTAPFIGSLLAIVLLNEALTWQIIVATILMGIGVYLHLTERHEHEHTHETLEHEHSHSHDSHHRHAHSPDDPAIEPHSHRHRHLPVVHAHPHFPDIHHRHTH
jgi:drug/metabolite transporter (DMT)-like permease